MWELYTVLSIIRPSLWETLGSPKFTEVESFSAFTGMFIYALKIAKFTVKMFRLKKMLPLVIV